MGKSFIVHANLSLSIMNTTWKITLRRLWKDKVQSGVNLFGLALGLASTTLIALWIQHELSVDSFHEHRSELYRILEHQTYGSDIYTFGATPGLLADKLRSDFPEITHTSRVSWGDRLLLQIGEQSFYEQGRHVDPDFLRMFSFPLLAGDVSTALESPNSIVISKTLADKYFLGQYPIGETLRIDQGEEFTITGVFADVPTNSMFRFDCLLPYYHYEQQNDGLRSWNNNGIQTYIRTLPGVDGATVTDKIANVVADNSEQDNVELLAYAIQDIYLRWDFEQGQYTGGGRISTIRMFALIAIFVLLLACINFMNLSTAKSTVRALEVGVRKVTGASRRVLGQQFLSESLLMTAMAAVFSIGLVLAALPFFNQIFELELSLWRADARIWGVMAIMVVVTGLLSGSYPAFFLARFDPVEVLKGQLQRGGAAARLRKVLVTTQFVICLVLIIGTIVVYQQIQFVKNQQLGYQKENLIYFPIDDQLYEKYDLVKEEMKQLPGVQQVTSLNGELHRWGNNTSGVDWPGKREDQSILFQVLVVDYDFVETIGAKLLAGRDFSPAHGMDTVNLVINETAARAMELPDDPIGQTVSLWDFTGQVIGMVEDFHVTSMRTGQDPVLMALWPGANNFYVRVAGGEQLPETLAALEKIHQRHNPDRPFEYEFTDQEYAEMYRNEERTGSLSKIFAVLAIVVACLGLFGLAVFAAERRRREIGIRKVLGASVSHLVLLLSKELVLLVLLAAVIAGPLAYYALSGWLNSFALHVAWEWWYFGLATALIVSVALITVGWQGLKAAWANPLGALR